jgi:hypothetical protein
MADVVTDALADARGVTAELCLPVESGRWLRLAVLALFVGGPGTAAAALRADAVAVVPPGAGPTAPPTGGWLPDALWLPERVFAAAVALGVVGLLAGLLWSLVSAVCEFVLVESLRTRTVRLRGPFADSAGRGLRLFGFRVAIRLPVVAAVLLFAGVAWGALTRGADAVALLGLVVPAVAILAVLAASVAAVDLVTTDFVVPTMLAERRGVLGAWRRVFALLRANGRAAATYLLVRVALSLGVAVVVGAVVGAVAVVLLAPALAVGAVVLAGDVGTLGLVAVGVATAVGVAGVALATAVAHAPVVVFLRGYALATLGRLESDLDLLGVGVTGDA